MLRSLLACLSLILALSPEAAAQGHALVASATVLSPVRVDATPDVSARADGGELLRAPESGSPHHVVTMSVVPAGAEARGAAEGRVLVRGAEGARMVSGEGGAWAEEALATFRARQEKEVDLRERSADGQTRLRVTYVVAVIA